MLCVVLLYYDTAVYCCTLPRGIRTMS